MKFKGLLFLLAVISAFFLFPSSVQATAATLSCAPPNGTFNIGETIAVDFSVDTRTYGAFGADLVITYDAALLTAVDTQVTAVTTTTKWTTAPTTNQIDGTLGKIRLDFGSAQASFSGSTVIARTSFKAKQAGSAQLQYTFFQQYDDTTPGVAKVWGKKDGTNLSNILTDVTNCIYVISSPTTPTPTTSSSGPTSPPATSAPVVSELPRSGTFETTLVFIVVALMTLGIGIMIPVFSKKD